MGEKQKQRKSDWRDDFYLYLPIIEPLIIVLFILFTVIMLHLFLLYLT